MIIKEKIKNLDLKKSLLVVMGTHHGIIYRIDLDKITQIDEHKVNTPEYSDNEGMSYHGGSEGSIVGHSLELKKEKAQEDFSKEFAEKINDICQKETVDSIFLFAPQEIHDLIDSDWSNEMKDFIQERFDGNFVSENPTKLILMIVELHDKKNKKEPTGEAKEILEKTDNF